MIVGLAAVASAFSLVCSGPMINRMYGETTSPTSTTGTYQIDLSAGRWCVDHCPMTFPIHKVTEMTMTLDRDVKGDGGHILEMNRRNGSFYSIYITGDYLIETSGKCVRGPFAGFPKNQF
jgi:hypothetical protein